MILWVAIYLLAIFACGFALAATVLAPGEHRLARIVGLSLALGCGGTSILLTWLSLLGLQPSRISIAVVTLGAFVTFIAHTGAKRLPLAIAVRVRFAQADLVALPALGLIA